jgi:large subunit ribosomal protein L23
MDATEVIVKPLVTEKSTRQSHSRNAYHFVVNGKATKPQIKAAVEQLYNVKVVDVRTLVRKGKAYRTKSGYRYDSDYKRAIVTLAEESKIELF